MIPISRAKCDRICRAKTAFGSFAELVDAHPGYRPSLEVADEDLEDLADAYDAEMEARGDPRRAYRYGRPRA